MRKRNRGTLVAVKGSYRSQAIRSFTSDLTVVFDKVHDLYIDYSIKLCEMFTDEESFNSNFGDARDRIKDSAYSLSEAGIREYLNNLECDIEDYEGERIKLLGIVLDSYVKVYRDFYCSMCGKFFSKLLAEGITSLKESDTYAMVVLAGKGYLDLATSRVNSFVDKAVVSYSYLDEIFLEECIPSIVINIKDDVFDTLTTVVRDICASFDVNIDEYDIDSVYDIVDSGSYSDERFYYIDDYKKLNKMAVDNGFVYVRSAGDHGIYKNCNGSVVIPQGRSIGKGLSIKIQKAISSLSV